MTYQGSKEWLEERKLFVTSSDASVIMGKNPWMDKGELWREKMNLAPPRKQTEAMKKGVELEPKARDWFIEKTGIKVEPTEFYDDFLMSSVDGYSKEKNCIVEIKSSKKMYEMSLNGQIPEYYMCQMQHQLLTSYAAHCFYVTFWKDEGFIIEVKRNHEWMEEYKPKALEFYKSLVYFEEPILIY
jgi:putative phage-type endonuclease